MGATKSLWRKLILCVLAVMLLAVVFTGCEITDPVTDAEYRLIDNDVNYYNQDHTTNDQAVDEFVDSITALRTYLNGESFVDSGYYMGVEYNIDILDSEKNTVGNFALRVQAYLFTFPYEDEDGNPIYKYYENGKYYDENNAEGTRKIVSGLEIHNEAIKKSDIKIEWYNGATNEVLIGLYYDGLNGNVDDPGNILYANIQGYKRSFPDFGDTVLYQQMIRLLVNLSVEGLLQSLGLQGDAGTGTIRTYMKTLIKKNYKRVVNGDIVSLFFDNITTASAMVAESLTKLLYKSLGVFGKKWDPMTAKFLGFKFSTVANATINSAFLDMQALISPDKSGVTNVLTDAVFYAHGGLKSSGINYDYTANIKFDYGWSYPDDLMLDKDFYQEFDYGQYFFSGLLYVPAWDSQFDAVIKTQMQEFDNSTNNVFIEFRDIANGELMIGVYYRDERAYLDITGLQYMYGWIELEALGFPQVYDEHIDLAELLGKFKRMINRVIVSIVDSILDPSESDKENSVLDYIISYTRYTEKVPEDIFSANTETLLVTMDLVKHVLEETGAGTYSTRQIITILDSLMPYTMDQIAIMLGIASAEVMLDKTYFSLTWDVDKQHFTIIMYTDVGVKPDKNGNIVSNKIFQLELDPEYFGDRRVTISIYDFSKFKPLREIWTYSGLLEGTFIFSSQETVDLSKLLSATIGESSGLNTPYQLPTNAGITFSLDYDQFVSDQYVEISVGGEKYQVFKKQKRSAFKLSVWLTGSESTIILQLMSDDVCFDNEVYKALPEREDELGYVWVNIACVTKNGTQVIPPVKIREDVFMASMSAYMHKQTSIEDDVSSFADNDFNLSLTSIISALCKDAYVIPAADKMEITSSNETLQNLFRVKGLIGNIKVHASFRTDDPETKNRVFVESERINYYMYQVGYFEDVTGNSPYDTALHDTLSVFFYEDYLPAEYPLKEREEVDGVLKEVRDVYDPLEYDFYVFPENVVLDDGTVIAAGTIYVYQLGAKRMISRQSMSESYDASSFFLKEGEENQDIKKVKFFYDDFILNPEFGDTNENRLVYEIEGRYYFRTYYGVQKRISDEDWEKASDGTVYIYWRALREVVLYKGGSDYYFFDRNRAIEGDGGDQAYMAKKTDRNLLFEHDEASITITEACKTQYAPRTNGSFMGEVRRYFITFDTDNTAELGAVDTLFYDVSSGYPQYYNKEDEENVFIPYDDEGTQIGDPVKMPIMLYVMEPCMDLSTRVKVYVKTGSTQSENIEFNAKYVIDWEVASSDKRGYMVLTDVIVAPGMMGECSFPIRIIVLNREIETDEYVSVFPTKEDVPVTGVPVIDEIDVDPYEYAMAKYAYLSNTKNLNPAYIHSEKDMEDAYNEQVAKFAAEFYAQEKFAFNIKFKWQTSYLFLNEVGDQYVQKSYYNLKNDVLTKYDWCYDKYELGTNVATSVSPMGGTIYLHTYFYGQLVALKVNIGKREFSHVKFYEEDNFDPTSYNYDSDNPVYIVGIYRANYYAEETYDVEDAPIFVFTDDNGNKYEYVFDMAVITGLQRNSDNSYAGVYERLSSYGIIWGDPTITNITGSGSYYEEFSYSYLYSATSFTELETRYDALGDKQQTIVKILTQDGEVIEDKLYLAMEDGRAKKRNVLGYSEFLKVYRGDDYTLLYETEASVAYKESTFDLYSRSEYSVLYENGYDNTGRTYDDLTAEEKAQTVFVLLTDGTIEEGFLYKKNTETGEAMIRTQWAYTELKQAQRALTVWVKNASGVTEERLYVQADGGYAAIRTKLAYDSLTEEEKGAEVVVLKDNGTTETTTLFVDDGGNATQRSTWRYDDLTAEQKGKKVKVKSASGYAEDYMFVSTSSGVAAIRNRLQYASLDSEKEEKVVVLNDDLTRTTDYLYVEDTDGYVKVRNEREISNELYENEADSYVYKEDVTDTGTAYDTLLKEEKNQKVSVLLQDGTISTMNMYVELSNGHAGRRNTKWRYDELGNTYDFRYYKEGTVVETLQGVHRQYNSLSEEEKALRVSVLKNDGTLETMDYYVNDNGDAAYRLAWTYAELESLTEELAGVARSGEMQKIVKVLFFDGEGTFLYAGFGTTYMSDNEGYAMTRIRHVGYEVEYGTGYAPKIRRDRLGNATVRDKDGITNKDSANRPYYYFTLAEDATVEMGDDGVLHIYSEGTDTGVTISAEQYLTYLNGSDKRDGGYLYLTEEQYNEYVAGDEQMHKAFAFDTGNSELLTTAGLDLYHLFRIYYVRGGEMYARSTLTNKEIPPSELSSQAIGATDFKVIELRVNVECPKLTITEEGLETDGLRGGTFRYNKVDTGSNQMGYYKVDPLRSESVYLPTELTIYFNYNNGANESTHTFTDVEWCAEFPRDNSGNVLFDSPVYTYRKNGADVELITTEVVEGVTRYKIALDLDKIEDVVTFYVKVKIGNEISGYQEVTVAVTILSKDPTDLKFYTVSGENRVLLDTPITETELISGTKDIRSKYYSYYVNTFENFRLPDIVVATFSDGRETPYDLVWEAARFDGQYVFAPNTIVTMVSSIGDNKISLDIFLVVIVENYALNSNDSAKKGIDVSIDLDNPDYYVSVKSTAGSGQMYKQLSELFRLSGTEVGYYFSGTSEYYIHVSTGSQEDGETPIGYIGLYTKSINDEYIWKEAITVFDLLSALYSKVTLNLTKSEMTMDEQEVISGKKSILDHYIQMVNGDGQTAWIQLGMATDVEYRVSSGKEVMCVTIRYETEYSTYDVIFNVIEGKEDVVRVRTLQSGGVERAMQYSELLAYIINENLATNYIDNKDGDNKVVGWKVNRLGDYNEDTDEWANVVSSYTILQNEEETVVYFNTTRLSDHVQFNSQTGVVVLKTSLAQYLTDEGGEINEKYIELQSNVDNSIVVMSAKELMYRLTHFYNYLRVQPETSGKTVQNKSFAINNLYKIMDINDMVVRSGATLPQNKYTISLGTGAGAYDLRVRIRFSDGVYLPQDSQATKIINVPVYTVAGEAQYANGYVLGNAISASVVYTKNLGVASNATMQYNVTSTDDKLIIWHVEGKEGIEDVSLGELIEKISARAVYQTGAYRSITISTLTNQGFRLRRTIVFEQLSGTMENKYSGGNANVPFEQSKTFVITDGEIKIENVYDYVDPSVEEYLGTNKYLPSTLYVTVNGRTIAVSNVKWEINSSWYGGEEMPLNNLDYKGTAGRYKMAWADILGFTDPETQERIGTTRVHVYIDVANAEILTLPWEDATRGNGLATETTKVSDSGNSYVVYVDAYSDGDALRKAIQRDEYGTYVALPTDLLVEYKSGKFFTFKNAVYKYGMTQVSRIYFNEEGMDISMMTSSAGDLHGLSSSLFNKRFLDLKVEVGLGQTLKIRFYFHDKRIKTADYIVYYSDLKDDDGNGIGYLTLSQQQREMTVGTSDKMRYIRNEENGNAMIASLMYYYVTYYDDDGNPVFYDRMTESGLSDSAIVNGTDDVPLYVESDKDGYVLVAKTVYNDLLPVISLDDETIRAAIKDDKDNEWAVYQDDLVSSTNNIRIQYNLENIIAQAQVIRNAVKEKIDGEEGIITQRTITANLNSLTAEGVKATLLTCLSGLSVEGFNESTLPTRSAYSTEECNKFATKRFLAQDDIAEKYAQSILRTVTGSGSNSAKEKSINTKIEEYYSELVQETFTAIIRDYVEKELSTVFLQELQGMSDEDYNNAVLYKNLVEGKINVDKAVELIYKLRSLKNNGIDPEIAAWQIRSSIEDALEMGYGYTFVYTDYKPNGVTVEYSSLGDMKDEFIVFKSYYNEGGTSASAESIYKYRDDNGRAQIATRQYAYEKLVQAIVVQMLYNAYEDAYAEAYQGAAEEKVALTLPMAEDDIGKAGICLYNIAYRTNSIFEKRLDLGNFCAVQDQYSGVRNTTYTLRYFANELALAYTGGVTSSEIKISKKILRSYLVNLVHEGMDFTASKTASTEDDDEWDSFVETQKWVINNSYLSIANYSSSINSIRRSLLSGTSISSTIKRLIALGAESFTQTVYAEVEYAGTIKNLQETNGQIVSAEKVVVGGVFKIQTFAQAIEDNTAKYLIEPYYSYREMPHKILIYFEDNYILNPGTSSQETITEEKEDVGGRPYMTTINWTKHGFEEKITYIGGSGSLEGTVASEVTRKESTVWLSAVATNREQNTLLVTTQYMEEGLAYAIEGGGAYRLTSDNRYRMTRDISYIYFREAKENGKLKYTLAYKDPETMANIFIFAGYDSTATVVYEFVNEYSDAGTRAIRKQYLYVYNPFVFSKQKDMPSRVVIGGEYMPILWDGIGVDPRGNITSTGEQSISGKVGNSAGQSVSMYISVAKWNYAGFYRKTDAAGSNGVTFTVGETEERFVYMNPLYFYFSAYSTYSSQDYYLLYFAVRIYKGGSTKRIVFEQTGDFRSAKESSESEGGFVGELFYPEDSRSVEYGTDDDTMEKVNERKRYLLYWDDTAKKRVINNQLSAQSDCIVSIGNDTMGVFTLESLRENGDTVAPVLATYSCERMNVSKAQLTPDRDALEGILTEKELSSEVKQATLALYDEIESVLYAQSGQIPVAITPDGYLPTTGNIGLKENNVKYDPDALRVRFLWNKTFSAVTSALIGFVGYAYPDVEESAKRNYARNLVMTWDLISAAERAEIISLAEKYEREVVNADRSESYSAAECQRDAYALLAINERYNYANGSEANRLRGGGNNNVRVTILVGVAGSTEVLEAKVTVKALFEDYTPLRYYEKTTTSYTPVSTLIGREDDLKKKSTMYIVVRKNYWTGTVDAYTDEEKGSPYDNIGDEMYKLLQIEANCNAVATDGTAREVMDNGYLVRVDNIIWEVQKDVGRMVSRSFSIAGETYTSDLLQLSVILEEDE